MKIIISFSIYTDNKIMSVYNMSASFNDTQKLRAGEDEVCILYFSCFKVHQSNLVWKC